MSVNINFGYNYNVGDKKGGNSNFYLFMSLWKRRFIDIIKNYDLKNTDYIK